MMEKIISQVKRQKTLSVLTCLVLIIGLTACSGNTETTKGEQPDMEKAVKISEPKKTSDKKQENIPEGFVLISGGTYTMGSPETESWRGSDETEHSVTVDDFYMGSCEVTQTEYTELMGENPSSFSGGDLPVDNVTWYEAIAYCNARSEADGLTSAYIIDGQNVSWDRSADGYRLPTEAEWEYACRAGTETPFNTENSISAEEANYFGHYPYLIEENYFEQDNLETQPGEYRQTTVPVGSFAPNQWGLYDMHGNVEEWCWDYYGAYNTEPQTNPSGPVSGTLRVNRGGGWNDFAKHIRSAYRSSMPGDNSSYNLGFRLARGAVNNELVSGTAENIINTEETSGENRILIAYFSWGGNTEGIAQQIQEIAGGDLFEIECVTPYSSDYNTVLEEAQRDQNIQARPELKTHVEDMDQYDTIILGYPNWWASIPMPVASFLEEYDFSGKTILPFCSHGGGRFGQSLTAISKLIPDASIKEGLPVSYSGGADLPEEITEWLEGLGI